MPDEGKSDENPFIAMSVANVDMGSVCGNALPRLAVTGLLKSLIRDLFPTRSERRDRAKI